jgi:hypothetical protein
MSNIKTTRPESKSPSLRSGTRIISEISKNNPNEWPYALGFYAAAKYAHLFPAAVQDSIKKEVGAFGLEAMLKVNNELNS